MGAKMVDVVKIVKSQQGRSERIQKAIEKFYKIDKSKRTKSYLETYVEQVQLNWTKFQNNHQTIYENEKNNVDDYIKGVLYETVEGLYIEFIADYKDEIEKLAPTTTSPLENSFSSPIAHIVKPDIKLPPISIPRFDGNYQTWRSFSELFNSMINKDPNLTTVQKLHYLKFCVTGEAERLLRQFDTIDSNYHKAWEVLEHRYNNKRVLVQTYLKKLTNQAIIKNETSQALKNLVDQTEELIHELSTLNIDTTTWDPILIHILAQKLPNETLYLWERELGASTEIPSFQQFTTFLETRFRTLEAIQTAQMQHPRYAGSASNNSSNKNTQSFLNQTQRCIRCKANHLLHTCKEFRNLTLKQKLDFIKQNKLCNNCLSSKHFSRECTSKHTCFKCHQRHHTLLHFDSIQNSGDHSHQHSQASNSNQQISHTKQDTIYQSQSSDSTSKVASNFLNYNSPKILLATALVRAHDSYGNSTTLRALIDSGSQLSFITKTACRKLKLKRSKTDVQVTGLGQTNTAHVHKKTQLQVQSFHSNYQTDLNVLIVNQITGRTPTKIINTSNLSYLDQITLADPQFAQPAPIDLLLGAEVYSSILEPGLIKGNDDTPSAQATQLGWILMGPTIDSEN